MRIAVLLAAAGTLLLAAGCSSSSQGASTGPTISLTPNTTVAGAPSTAPGDTSAATDPAGAEAPPASLPSDPAKAIQTVYATSGGTLTDAEATCMAQSTGPNIVTELQATLEGGDLSEDAGKAFQKALAACEPASYVSQTTAAIVQESGATQAQAACVLSAADKLFATDDAVLTQAIEQGSAEDWPAPEHQKFHDAVRTCVPEDLAEKIVGA